MGLRLGSPINRVLRGVLENAATSDAGPWGGLARRLPSRGRVPSQCSSPVLLTFSSLSAPICTCTAPSTRNHGSPITRCYTSAELRALDPHSATTAAVPTLHAPQWDLSLADAAASLATAEHPYI